MPTRDANIAELTNPQPQPPQCDTTDVAGSGWERWLRGHLNTELENLHRALGQLLAEEREKLERKTSAFELKLAKLSGAVDVLRGAQPPPAKFPTVKAWSEDMIYHEGEIVAFDGGTYQAQRDTARAPGTRDWICLALAGPGFTVRGTYDGNEAYKHLDVVMINGSSFVALKDNPGPCPDSGDWHLRDLCASRSFLDSEVWSGEAVRMVLEQAIARQTGIDPVWPIIHAHVLEQAFKAQARQYRSSPSLASSVQIRQTYKQRVV
jgi:hypothetical protein